MARRKLWRTIPGALLVATLSGAVRAEDAGQARPSAVLSASGPSAADVLRPNGQPQTDADPVVANVDGHPLHLSELGLASDTLPENLRTLPFDRLYPALLERMIDHQAIVAMARRQGMEDDPAIRREIAAATERVLEAAYLRREAMAKVTDDAIRARYNQEFGSRSATEEVRARHILVATEAEANDVIAQLKSGADFAALAAKLSKDPDGQRGGDLGFFRREQVWPGFADLAFTLDPGQVGPKPVHNEFGWHVIKVEERRIVAPPSLADARAGIREELTAEAIRAVVRQARAQLPIHEFNADGSVKLDSGPSGARTP